MQVSLPSLNKSLKSPLVISLISAFCSADPWRACCVLLESHIHRAFIAAFSYGTSTSQLTAHKGAQVEAINPSEWQPLLTYISMCRFLLKMIPMRVHKRNDLECWVWSTWSKTKCFGNTALGLCAPLAGTKENRPCSAVVGAGQNCQLIN